MNGTTDHRPPPTSTNLHNHKPQPTASEHQQPGRQTAAGRPGHSYSYAIIILCAPVALSLYWFVVIVHYRGMMTKQSRCIAGSITAGCFSTLLGHPLDTIKVHIQTNPNLSKKASTTLDVVQHLAKGDTLRLFRGIGAPMANQIIMNTVMFTVFNKVKDASNQSSYLDENSSALVAGLFSGFATACLSTPTDWIKIQQQISLSNNNESNINMAKQTRHYGTYSIIRNQIINDGKFHPLQFTQTLYRGHVANLGREGVFTMVYLGLYDRITHAVKVRKGKVHNNDTTIDNQPLDMGEVILMSSFTGACAWLCNYPFDTIKTVMQAGGIASVKSSTSSAQQRISMKSAIQSIYKSGGGWRAFWRGAGSSTIRAMLVTSSRMLAYEKTIQLLS